MGIKLLKSAREVGFNPEEPPPGGLPYCDARVIAEVDPDRDANHGWQQFIAGIVIGIVVGLFLLGLLLIKAPARDDGRYAGMDPKIHAWFDQLASGKGLCCSFADGFSVQDVDWDTHKHCVEGPSTDEMNCVVQYRVHLHGEWIEVPDNAVVTEPNRFGPAVVWPYMDANGSTQIRCFLPGAGA